MMESTGYNARNMHMHWLQEAAAIPDDVVQKVAVARKVVVERLQRIYQKREAIRDTMSAANTLVPAACDDCGSSATGAKEQQVAPRSEDLLEGFEAQVDMVGDLDRTGVQEYLLLMEFDLHINTHVLPPTLAGKIYLACLPGYPDVFITSFLILLNASRRGLVSPQDLLAEQQQLAGLGVDFPQ